MPRAECVPRALAIGIVRIGLPAASWVLLVTAAPVRALELCAPAAGDAPGFVARCRQCVDAHAFGAGQNPARLVRNVSVPCPSVAPFSMFVYDHGRGGVNDAVSKRIIRDGDWEPQESAMICRALFGHRRHAVDGTPTLLDVGANVGWFSLLAAAAGARVHSVEANYKNAWMLRASRCLNGFEAAISLHETGVGSVAKNCTLLSPRQNHGDTFVSCDGAYDEKLWDERARIMGWTKGFLKIDAIRIVTLDSLLGDARIDVIKIDIEGFEPDAIRGAAAVLDRPDPPRAIFTEVVPKLIIHRGFDPISYLREFVERNYTVTNLAPDHIFHIHDAAELKHFVSDVDWTAGTYDLVMRRHRHHADYEHPPSGLAKRGEFPLSPT